MSTTDSTTSPTRDNPRPTRYDLQSSASAPITLRVIPELAEEIGLNPSLVLLQITFWIRISNHYHDGHYWTFQSLRDMQRAAFPFWSHMTIQRALETLVERNLLFVRDDLNKLKYDNTRWFAINPEGFKSLESVTLAELTDKANRHVTGVYQNVTPLYQDVTTIPEITPESTQREDPLPDELPDHLAPFQRKIVALPAPQPDGGTRAYSLIEAWCDGWDYIAPAARRAAHKSQANGANTLADMGATPEAIRDIVAGKRASGKQPHQCPLAFLTDDFMSWQQRQAAPAEVSRVWREITE